VSGSPCMVWWVTRGDLRDQDFGGDKRESELGKKLANVCVGFPWWRERFGYFMLEFSGVSEGKCEGC